MGEPVTATEMAQLRQLHMYRQSPPRYEPDDAAGCVHLGQNAAAPLLLLAGGRPAAIARYSSDPSAYQSGLQVAAVVPELAEAQRQAVAVGLLP